ncbi:MAG TPA: type IV toxin-antitoxin system AbiEi family antitoxin domain-containing protein, partial [Streptomyces sp.]|nr:type IV toxin-antitoxin system AbiEi family antitoxin domain-containing protein [Streptomyces sp.]
MNDTNRLLSRVHDFARRQHDVLTIAQSRQLGVDRALLRRLVRHGEWQPLLFGIYWTRPRDEPGLRTRVCAA